jgi:hypothetical protein
LFVAVTVTEPLVKGTASDASPASHSGELVGVECDRGRERRTGAAAAMDATRAAFAMLAVVKTLRSIVAVTPSSRGPMSALKDESCW